ncbi:MAG: hypothetical protein QM323_08065 [Acidobacteriota bacterium]|nr:hypothetical protein [Acidobacteriota bacterium]
MSNETLFTTTCTPLTSMEVHFVIDGTHHKVVCNRFEVISTTEINFREAISAEHAAKHKSE